MPTPVPPSNPTGWPKEKPPRRRAWLWISAWVLGFFLLPTVLAGLLYREHIRQLTQSLPLVADSPTRIAPSWVPVRNNFRIAETVAGEERGSASLLAVEPIESVASFYESSLRKEGFQVSSKRMEQDDSTRGAIINGVDDSGHVVVVTLSRSERGTRIELDFSGDR